MAGIGFVLRRLLKEDTLTSKFQAYFHSVFASSGQWLFTIIALGMFYYFTQSLNAYEVIDSFRGIILYNFALSLVICAPISITTTRYLSDCIYRQDLQDATSMLLGSLILTFVISTPFIILLYFYFVQFSTPIALAATVNFFVISGIWVTNIFLSALKYYSAITFTYLFGMIIAVVSGVLFSDRSSPLGLLVGFTAGLMFILVCTISLIFTEYPPSSGPIFKFFSYFKRYWQIALGGLVYNLAIWVDKWIMWFCPDALQLPNGMVMYPLYDSTMFFSYLSVIPVLAMFLLHQETTFYGYYCRYYSDIQEHSTYEHIYDNFLELWHQVSLLAKNIFLFQGCFAMLLVLVTPKILDLFRLDYLHVSIFRYGVIGAAFQVWGLFLIILLSYLDNRRDALFIQCFFLISNTLFTLFFMKFGFPLYGFGYCLSSILTFLVGGLIVEKYLRELPYHTFVTNNLRNS